MSIQEEIQKSAEEFYGAIVTAIRAAIDEALTGIGESAVTKRAPSPARASAPKAKKKEGGRLARRSLEEIQEVVGAIAKLLANKPEGMRSEEIRKALDLDVREVPRVLKEGLATKVLSSKGQKRATVYTVRGRAAGKKVVAVKKKTVEVKKKRPAAKKKSAQKKASKKTVAAKKTVAEPKKDAAEKAA